MKVNSKKTIDEKYWTQITQVLKDNLILVLMVLHEQYGFSDRQRTVLDAVYEKAKLFDQMARDEILEIKTQHEREKYHKIIHEIIKLRAHAFMPPDIWDFFYNSSTPTFTETRAASSRKEKENARKEQLSLKQAMQMQVDLQAARGWAMNNSAYSTSIKSLEDMK